MTPKQKNDPRLSGSLHLVFLTGCLALIATGCPQKNTAPTTPPSSAQTPTTPTPPTDAPRAPHRKADPVASDPATPNDNDKHTGKHDDNDKHTGKHDDNDKHTGTPNDNDKHTPPPAPSDAGQKGSPLACTEDAHCGVYLLPKCIKSGCSPPCGHVYRLTPAALNRKRASSHIATVNKQQRAACHIRCILCAGRAPAPPSLSKFTAVCRQKQCTLKTK